MEDRDKMRSLIMGEMTKQKDSEEIFENVSSNAPKIKRKSITANFKNDIFSAMETNGYSLRDANVQAAVSMFFTNLENI